MRRELQRVMATTTPSAAQAVDRGDGGAARGARATSAPAGAARRPPSGRDPKDGIQLATRLGRNGMTVARTEPEKAIRELTALLAEDPGMLVALRTRAVAYEAAGQYEDAIRDLRDLEKRGALTAEDAVVLGDNLRLAGRAKEAAEVLERTARENPKFAQPWLSLAAVFVQQKRIDEAAAAYEKVLAIDPDHTEALRGLGDLALIRGDLDAAGEATTRGSSSWTGRDAGGPLQARGGAGADGPAPTRRSLSSTKASSASRRTPRPFSTWPGPSPRAAAPRRPCPTSSGPSPRARARRWRSNGLGLTRLELGDRAGAAAAFRESLRLDPRQPNVAEALRDLGRP